MSDLLRRFQPSASETIETLITEITYHKGEVVSDPQTWSETRVSGGGSTGKNRSAPIQSSTTTWTSFIIQKDTGKEYLVKFPASFAAREGNIVIAADLRGSTIAVVNDVSDTFSGTKNVVPSVLSEKEKRGMHPLISYGVGLGITAAAIALVQNMGAFFFTFGWVGIVIANRATRIKKIERRVVDAALNKLRQITA